MTQSRIWKRKKLTNDQINHSRGTSSLETIFIKTSLWHINYQVVAAQIDKINEILYLLVKRSYTAGLIKEIEIGQAKKYFTAFLLFLYPLKTSENYTVFWCFQVGEVAGRERVHCEEMG